MTDQLVAHVFKFVRPGGGPGGYLFNLRTGLSLSPDERIKIVATSHESEVRSHYGSYTPVKMALGKVLSGSLVPRVSQRKQVRRWTKPLNVDAETSRVLKRSQVLVFHTVRQAYQYLTQGSLGRQSGQQIYIMNHGPTDFSTELAEGRAMRWGSREDWYRVRAKWAVLELKTYRLVDGLIAPCRAALEAYFEFDRGMQQEFRQVPVYELRTGAPQLNATLPKEKLAAELGIPADAFVIGFFGRYHTHKGYDLFIEVAKVAVAKGDRRFVFLSAGEGLVQPPKGLGNFMDLGWQSKNLPEYINYVDLVLAPNRYNYFDLMILEAMSLGKAVLTSARGGNTCFDDSAAGVIRIDDLSPEGIYDHLSRLANRSRLRELGRANKAAYERVYNLETFAKRHSAFADYVLALA